VSALPNIPDHTLRRCIGRGAYGEVWLARNVMGMPRAVKIIRRSKFESDRPYEREFAGIQGYEPVSRSADGLVHVLHVGRNDADGYFYYVMELADSIEPRAVDFLDLPDDTEPTPLATYAPRTLRSDIKRLGRLPVADCIRVAHDVVAGLVRLHDRGLVHRDVKPGNIIFIDGRAKLADVGLVSRGNEGRTFVGTEGYIPPEGPGTPAADLYALGMVLYESVTGYPPDQFPKVPTEWFKEDESTDSLELYAVVLKACEGAKERRYQNADELQADLALLQSGQSVRHLRALEERVARWRRIGWVAAVSLAIAVSTALVANWRARVAAESHATETKLLEQARHSLARAESAERESRHQLFTALLEQARATVRSGEMGQRIRALDAIRRAAAISNSVELRREAFAALSLPDLRFQRELPIGPEYYLKQLDPSFERIAVCRQDGPVEILSVADNRLLASLPATTNLICYSVLWSPDGRYLAVNRDYDMIGYRSDLEVWELKETPRLIVVIKDVRYKARTFHPVRPQLLVGGADGLMMVWDLLTGKEWARATFEATPQELAYSPDGNAVAAIYQRTDGWGASVHNAPNGAFISSNVFPNRLVSFAWHPSGSCIALSDYGGTIHLMDARTSETRVLGRHKAEAVNTTFNSDGRYLITGAWGRELICWDVIRRQRAFSINVESYVAQFRADGLACAMLTRSGVQLHAFERPMTHYELPEELAPRVRHASFSPDGRFFAASSDERLGVWDLTCNGPGAMADYAADSRPFWAPDGTKLFGSSSRNRDCYCWRVSPATNVFSSPGLERLPLTKPPRFDSLCVGANHVAWTSARGSRIDGLDHISTNHAKWSPTLRGVNGLSADGRWLAIFGPYTPNLSVYRLPELEQVASLTNRARVSGFGFTPSGEELIVASNGQVEFWSTTTWQQTRMATNFIGLTGSGALFQPDGRAIWLAKNLVTGGLYDSVKFEPLMLLPNGMFPLALSRDGAQLAVSVEGRYAQIWDMNTLRLELAKLGLQWK
jgi:WD40 repeat protein